MKNLTNFQFKTRTKQHLGSSPVQSQVLRWNLKASFLKKTYLKGKEKRNMMSLLQLRWQSEHFKVKRDFFFKLLIRVIDEVSRSRQVGATWQKRAIIRVELLQWESYGEPGSITNQGEMSLNRMTLNGTIS